MYSINLYKKGRINLRIAGFHSWIQAAAFAHSHWGLGDLKIIKE